MVLCYKAWQPRAILRSGIVETSKIDGRDRGVSFSANLKESGHGPFMIVFQPDRPWFSQFVRCQYGPRPEGADLRIHKQDFFAVEEEWWSERRVEFALNDVARVSFMSDSPGSRIHPRICRREWRALIEEFGKRVDLVEDPSRYPQEQAIAFEGKE